MFNKCMLLLALMVVGCAIAFIPVLAKTKPALKYITVLTYNIDASRRGLDGILSVLQSSGADIICLQEANQQGRATDPAPPLIKAYSRWHSMRGGSNGELLVLSRFPLRNRSEPKLGIYRKCLTCQAEVDGAMVTLVCVHFNTMLKGGGISTRNIPTYAKEALRVRREQAHALSRILRGIRGPLIVSGDLNSPPGTYPPALLSRHLTDCYQAKGEGIGATYSDKHPVLRIDYIFVSRHFQIVRSRLMDRHASDHLPLQATLLLKD